MTDVFDLPVNYENLSPYVRRKVREQYIREQQGKCFHCSGKLTEMAVGSDSKKSIDVSRFPATFFKHPVHLHHNHKNGMTIGAVHAHCNAVLFQYYGE